EPLQSLAGEHLGVAEDRRDLPGLIPAARIAARGELSHVRLRGAQARRRRVVVERVAVLREVRDRDRWLQVRGQERELLPDRRRVGIDEDAERARRVEEAGERRGDAAEREPRRGRLERRELRGRLLGGDRRRAAAAVDEDEALQLLRAGLPAEVPRGVRRRDRAAERVAAEHHAAVVTARLLHD